MSDGARRLPNGLSKKSHVLGFLTELSVLSKNDARGLPWGFLDTSVLLGLIFNSIGGRHSFRGDVGAIKKAQEWLLGFCVAGPTAGPGGSLLFE